MRQVEIAAIGQVRLVDVGDPRPGPGEVLAATRCVGICGSDLHALAGRHPFIELPYLPGHEVAATVVEMGEGVTGFAVGDRVLVEPNLVCRECESCRSGRYNLCERLRVFGCQTQGAMADRFTIAAERLHHVPDEVADAAAALVEPLSTAVHAVRLAGPLDGSRVAILGAGSIGLLTLLVARDAGAADVVVTDLLAARRERALRLGAAAAFAGDREDVASAIRAHFGGRADVVFDCVSTAASVDQAVTLAENGGTVLVIGVAAGAVNVPLHRIQDREIDLRGSAMYVGDDVRTAIALVRDGAVPLHEFVTSSLDLSEAAAAFELARQPGEVKVQLTVG